MEEETQKEKKKKHAAIALRYYHKKKNDTNNIAVQQVATLARQCRKQLKYVKQKNIVAVPNFLIETLNNFIANIVELEKKIYPIKTKGYFFKKYYGTFTNFCKQNNINNIYRARYIFIKEKNKNISKRKFLEIIKKLEEKKKLKKD